MCLQSLKGAILELESFEEEELVNARLLVEQEADDDVKVRDENKRHASLPLL